MQQTVVMCESEVITENDDSQDPAREEFHDEFMMSRWRLRGPVKQNCGIGREVPADHEAQGQVNAATAA